jgi:hypothetical protein
LTMLGGLRVAWNMKYAKKVSTSACSLRCIAGGLDRRGRARELGSRPRSKHRGLDARRRGSHQRLVRLVREPGSPEDAVRHLQAGRSGALPRLHPALGRGAGDGLLCALDPPAVAALRGSRTVVVFDAEGTEVAGVIRPPNGSRRGKRALRI